MKYFLVITFLFFGGHGLTQTITDTTKATDSLLKRDSLPVKDSALLRADSLAASPRQNDSIRLSLQYPFTSDSFLYRKRLFFSFTNPIRYTITEVQWEGKEAIFYGIIALLLFFAVVRNSFSRYLSDLLSSYFRTTVRQKQVKEQLLQNPLPSMLFNLFFILSTAVFVSLTLQHFNRVPQYPFWLLAAYAGIGISVIYSGKFLVLKFFGWVFQMTDATNTYIFIVFSTNKIIGVLLLPFIILTAFTYGSVNAAAVTLGLFFIGALLAYRYFLSFISINRLLKIDIFHFLIYLAAFEVLPLLLINKLLLTILREIS